MKRFLTGFLISLSLLGSLVAEEAPAPAKAEAKTRTAGSTVYDAEAIDELYSKYKKENESRNSEPPLIGDMETFLLKDLEVFGDDLVNERDLEERLDRDSPQNRINRLNRIARVNPEAAAEIQYALRSDQVFFSSEGLPRITGGDPGYTADMSIAQIGAALSKVGKLFGGKKKDNDGR